MSSARRLGLIARLLNWLAGGHRTPPPRPSDPTPDPPAETEPPPAWAAVLPNAAAYERFESTVRTYFRQQGRSPLIIDGMVSFPASTLDAKYGLGNLVRSCAQSPESEWAGLVAEHFGVVARSHVEADAAISQSFDACAPLLGLRFWDASRPPDPDRMIVRELIPGILAAPCIDLPHSIVSISREHVERWGISDDTLFEHAERNIAALARVEMGDRELDNGQRLRWLTSSSLFTAASALRLHAFPNLCGTHGAFVSMPTCQSVLAVAFDSIQSVGALNALIYFTHTVYSQNSGAVSPRVFWYEDGVWTPIPYEFRGNQVDVTPPEALVERLNAIAGEEDEGIVE